MIAYLNGTIVEKNLPTVTVEVNGLGYGCYCSLLTYQQLPSEGCSVKLYTVTINNNMFAFISTNERDMFNTLVKIVSPKIALSILSSFSLEDIKNILKFDDKKKLMKVPGMNKETCATIMSSFSSGDSSVGMNRDDIIEDIKSSLIALGYSEKDIKTSMKYLPDTCSVQEGIKVCLQYLSN